MKKLNSLLMRISSYNCSLNKNSHVRIGMCIYLHALQQMSCQRANEETVLALNVNACGQLECRHCHGDNTYALPPDGHQSVVNRLREARNRINIVIA